MVVLPADGPARSKAFKSKKAYDQHTLSNKHKEIARRGAAEGPKAASIGAGAGAGPAAAAPPATEAVSRPKVVTEETAIANPAPPKPRAVPVTCCLFDGSHHVDLEACVRLHAPRARCAQ